MIRLFLPTILFLPLFLLLLLPADVIEINSQISRDECELKDLKQTA